VTTPTTDGSPRGWKRVLFWGLLVVIGFAALEISAQIGLRVFRGYDGEHLYQYAFDPYRNIHPTPNFVDRRGIAHNSVGFRRSSEVEVGRKPNSYRVFLMGASTAYGLGGLWPHLQREFAVIKNSETIDAYLEQMLRDSLPGVEVEVINAAVTSTWTHHHLIYLNQHILRYDPDMVLFLDGFNDFFAAKPTHDQFADYSYGLPSRVIMGEPSLFALAYANAWWLFRKSAAAHVGSRAASGVMAAIKGRPEQTPLNVPRAVAGLKQVFPENALKMHERSGLILRAEEVRTLFILQPLLILARDRPGAPEIERTLFDFNVSSYVPNYEEFVQQVVPFFVEQETAMAARVGADFLDLSDPFDGIEGQVYTDYAHLTPLGNRVVAERILARSLAGIRADIRARADTTR